MKFFLLLGLGMLSMVTVLAEEESEALQKFSLGIKQFSADVYQELTHYHSDNFLVSSILAHILLAVVHAGAKGKTAQQISSALHLPKSSKKIHEIFTELLPALKGNNFYNLTTGNKIYVKNGFKISGSFKYTAVNVFGVEMENIDFAQTKEAASKINKWVADLTHNKIKNLIRVRDLGPDTTDVLLSAIYFRGKWAKEFHKNETEKKPFYPDSKSEILTDMMQVTGNFLFHESSIFKAKFLVLPYQGHDISMTFVLPNDIEDLSVLENRLADVIEPPSYATSTVTVQIPKFKIETTIQFNPILKDLGIKHAFQNDADFSGFGANQEILQIRKVVQKAFIEVNEEGTTAAAAMFKSMTKTSFNRVKPPHNEFIADHPFIFYLKHRSTILFVGRYVSSTKEE